MIVICRYKTGIVLPDTLFPLGGWSKDMKFPRLTIDSLYIVYGVSVIKNIEWYLICEDGFDKEESNFPLYLPSMLFEVVSDTPSKYWVKRIQIDEYTGEKVVNMGFPEILDEEFFFGNLLEDYQREVCLFLKYKNYIDKEIVDSLKNL